jgi:IS5 family transposase
MDRCHLTGETGDRLHAVLCAAGYNIRWLLRMIAKKGIAPCWRFFCACCGWPRLGQNRSGQA